MKATTLAALTLSLVGGCYNRPAPDGVCIQDPIVQSGCTASSDGGTAESLGLTGYSCTGSARPDLQATFVDNVPQGLVCANQIAPGDGGAEQQPQTYCCTSTTTSCMYNPVLACDPGTYGYQCQGGNRPESYNPEIRCGQGVRDANKNLSDYCCSGTGLPVGCSEYDNLACSPASTGFCCQAGLVGWQCPTGQAIPKGQDLGSNKSRADQYYLLCSMAGSAPNPKIAYYCCFPPAQVPVGGTCTQDLNVPNCAPGRFGFACYGDPVRDIPDNEYPMKCDPGVSGVSGQGYPATLYCCDFQT
jgi:hypothetical protein